VIKFKTIHGRLTFFFLVFGVIPLLLAMLIEYQEAAHTIDSSTVEHLKSVRAIRGRQLVEYLNFVREEMVYLANNKATVSAAKELTQAVLEIEEAQVSPEMYRDVSLYYEYVFLHRYNSLATYPINLGAVSPSDFRTIYLQHRYISNRSFHKMEPSRYDLVHDRYHGDMVEFLHRFSYTNINIVDAQTGYIVYSGVKTEEFGSNLFVGPYSESVMGRLFKEMRLGGSDLTVKFADLESFIPALNKPVLLVAAPILENDELLAVLIMTVPSEDINMITAGANNWAEDGLGRTGESYLVGRDYKMRSDSRAITEDFENYLSEIKQIGDSLTQIQQIESQNTSILYQHVSNPEIQSAFVDSLGSVGIGLNYRNREVIRTVEPLRIYDLQWAIVAEIETDEAFAPVKALRRRSITSVVILMVAIILAASFISGSITAPIRNILEATRSMAKGELSVRVNVTQRDEIGKLAVSFNSMAESLEIQQAEIQTQNKNILEKNEELSQTLGLLSQKNNEIQLQKTELETAYLKIKSSISYALRIQQAMLPPIESIKMVLPDFFVLFKPKDVVSGDFYWFGQLAKEGRRFLVLAAVDCTGHGVPGAFMSLIGNDLLDSIVLHDKELSPKLVLQKVHEGIVDSLNQRSTESKDGMAMGICVLDLESSNPTLRYAGSQHPLVYVQGERLEQIKADRVSLGGTFHSVVPNFTEHIIPLGSVPTTFYMFSDGYQDQFGGTNNAKFYSRKLVELLYKVSDLKDMNQQKQALDQTFEEWKGQNSQVDDVLVLGFRV
jgi:serine phosphatase RsbU (regulator of sigma subunit)